MTAGGVEFFGPLDMKTVQRDWQRVTEKITSVSAGVVGISVAPF